MARRPSAFVEAVRDLRERVEDGCSARRPDRLDALQDRRAIVGRPGHGANAQRERRDDHAVERRQVTRERRRRALHEIHPARHAGAAVDQQRERRADRLLPDDVELLRHVVLEDGELRRREALDEAPALVLDRRLEAARWSPPRLGDLERLEHHPVAAPVPEGSDDLDGDLASLERILVHPLGRIRRASVTVPRSCSSTKNRTCPGSVVLRVPHLRDDADCAGQAGAAERRRDPDAERRLLARARAAQSARARERQSATARPRLQARKRRQEYACQGRSMVQLCSVSPSR